MDQGINQMFFIIPVLFLSLCVHEYSHAKMAVKKGDQTPKLRGRLTLNPLAHVDLIGTLLLPALFFYYGLPIIGWAKPVPVNMANLKKGRTDMAWVAAAGPLSNIFLSLLATLVLANIDHLPLDMQTAYYVAFTCHATIQINILLAFFNLLPIPPLDGFMMLQALLSTEMLGRLRFLIRYGFIIVLVLFYTGIFRLLILDPAIACYKFLVQLAS